MSEHPRSARFAEPTPTDASGDGVPPAPEPSQYHMTHLMESRTAAAIGSTPGEIRAAMSAAGDGPWTTQEVQAAIDAWRAREIPAY